MTSCPIPLLPLCHSFHDGAHPGPGSSNNPFLPYVVFGNNRKVMDTGGHRDSDLSTTAGSSVPSSAPQVSVPHLCKSPHLWSSVTATGGRPRHCPVSCLLCQEIHTCLSAQPLLTFSQAPASLPGIYQQPRVPQRTLLAFSKRPSCSLPCVQTSPALTREGFPGYATF